MARAVWRRVKGTSSWRREVPSGTDILRGARNKKLDRRDRLFVLGQAGYRGASSETGVRRNPRDKHDTSETFSVREWSGKAKLANLPKVRCPPLAAAPASFAPTKQTTKRKPSGVPFFVVADRGGAEEEKGNIQHVV